MKTFAFLSVQILFMNIIIAQKTQRQDTLFDDFIDSFENINLPIDFSNSNLKIVESKKIKKKYLILLYEVKLLSFSRCFL